MNVLPWWPIALKEMGVAEVQGEGDNPRITAYLGCTGLPAFVAQNDETPWCSAFVQWCVNQVGVKGTGSAWARSWLEWGRAAEVGEDLPMGAIVVLSRDGGGHVGFLHSLEWSVDGLLLKSVRILGGNQGDRVQISQYPASRLLGVRVPP